MQRMPFSFWAKLFWYALFQPRLTSAVDAAQGFIPQCQVSGHAHLPATGGFMLACNHYLPRTVMRTVAAALTGLSLVRPELVDDVVLIVGEDRNRKRSLLGKLTKRMADWLHRRWHRNVLTIPMGGEPSLSALKQWRREAAQHPVFVFPEGRASTHFQKVRDGSGRWLRGLKVPVIPMAVWHQNRCWHVRFGAPVDWCGEDDDFQLARAMAEILPPELAPQWAAASGRKN